eukprot:scaffold98800_cov54-Phaeocystis_antarctica.AAC.3
MLCRPSACPACLQRCSACSACRRRAVVPPLSLSIHKFVMNTHASASPSCFPSPPAPGRDPATLPPAEAVAGGHCTLNLKPCACRRRPPLDA